MKKSFIFFMAVIGLLCQLSSSHAFKKVVVIPKNVGEKVIHCREIVHCDGNPYGGIINDVCGQCGGDGSSCAGCDGIPNSGLVIDKCGVCGGDNSSCAGCDGIPNSGLAFDKCGVCGGDNSSCSFDCNGDLNGKAYVDNCGVCVGGKTWKKPCAKDCNGKWGGSAKRDKCGVCGGDGTSCFSECGNGIVENREECDDGNRQDGDGCSKRCTIEKRTCSSFHLDFCKDAASCQEAGGFWHLGRKSCKSSMGTVRTAGGIWQQIPSPQVYTWDDAIAYCKTLNLAGYSDWRLPSKKELKTLVRCSNATPTPLKDWPSHPSTCGDGNKRPFRQPTIDKRFSCPNAIFWTRTTLEDPDYQHLKYAIDFSSGATTPYDQTSEFQVRCIRGK